MPRCCFLVLLAAGCTRSTSSSPPPADSAPPPGASAPPTPSDGGLRFGSGHSASGPGHYSLQYGTVQDGPGTAAVEKADFGPLLHLVAAPRRRWRSAEFDAKPSTKDAGLLACVDAALKSVSFPEAARGTTFDVGVKLSP